MTSAWTCRLDCLKGDADALAIDQPLFPDQQDAPVLVVAEAAPDQWFIEAYFSARPTPADLQLLASLSSAAAPADLVCLPLPEQDWVVLSQQGMEPIRAGRFFVATPDADALPPAGALSLEIPAAQAFGTGHHETTYGCLLALDRLARQHRPRRVLDLGTGTGILAFAAARLWRCPVLASDNDPVAIEVAVELAGRNRLPVRPARCGVSLLVADGTRHRRIRRGGPYDLVIANILAGPLIDMARDIAAMVAPGGHLVLAGLLDTQAQAVAQTYRTRGLVMTGRISTGEWPTLILRRP